MTKNNAEITKDLAQKFNEVNLYRPFRTKRYDEGMELSYDISMVYSGKKATITLVIDKFVGGGFAGQVYRVKITKIESSEPIESLKVGNLYAMKILVPPSGSSLFFRNAVYWVGFGGQFQLQVNSAASRSGAIWQKFIRRGAQIKFGSEESVVDIFATLIDKNIGSCGEISEWVSGRD